MVAAFPAWRLVLLNHYCSCSLPSPLTYAKDELPGAAWLSFRSVAFWLEEERSQG